MAYKLLEFHHFVHSREMQWPVIKSMNKHSYTKSSAPLVFCTVCIVSWLPPPPSPSRLIMNTISYLYNWMQIFNSWMYHLTLPWYHGSWRLHCIPSNCFMTTATMHNGTPQPFHCIIVYAHATYQDSIIVVPIISLNFQPSQCIMVYPNHITVSGFTTAISRFTYFPSYC